MSAEEIEWWNSPGETLVASILDQTGVRSLPQTLAYPNSHLLQYCIHKEA